MVLQKLGYYRVKMKGEITMKVACFIPIKANSERVPGKNLRLLNGKKLYEYICEHVKEAAVFDDVFVDTNSNEIADYAQKMGFHVIERKPELALNTANGNDLLVYHYEKFPEYDYYFQLFATAPYLQPETIRSCYNYLVSSEEYDSCFTALENHSFYWYSGTPINRKFCQEVRTCCLFWRKLPDYMEYLQRVWLNIIAELDENHIFVV